MADGGWLSLGGAIYRAPTVLKMTRSQVKPANYKKAEYQNVLHLTIGGDSQQNGDRTPAVWIHPEKGILISSSVNGTSDYGFFCLQHLPKGSSIKMFGGV